MDGTHDGAHDLDQLCILKLLVLADSALLAHCSPALDLAARRARKADVMAILATQLGSQLQGSPAKDKMAATLAPRVISLLQDRWTVLQLI